MKHTAQEIINAIAAYWSEEPPAPLHPSTLLFADETTIRQAVIDAAEPQ